MTDEDERGAAAADAGRSAASATEEEWQFDPADFDDPGADGEAGDEDADGNVAGSLLELEDEIEPGTPTLEGTMFVVLGALATLLFLLEAGGAI
jgi:hypothetical protein